MPYIGKAPSSGIRSRFVYTATGSQTTFTGADDNNKTLGYTDGEYVDVYLNGVLQDPADYTATSKTSVVLDSGATASDIVEIVVYDTFSVFNGTFSGDLTVDGTTLKVDSTNNRVGILTASPATALDVAGTITSDGLTVDGSVDVNGATSFNLQTTGTNYVFNRTDAAPVLATQYNGTTNAQFLTGTDGSLSLRADPTDNLSGSYFNITVDGTTALTIDDSQNIGIGTSIPADRLVVQKDASSITPLLVLKNDDTTDDNGMSIDFSGKDTSANNITYGRIDLRIPNHATEKSDMRFYIRNDSGSFSEMLRLTKDEDIETIQDTRIMWRHQAGGTARASIEANSSDNIIFKTGSSLTERLRLQSGGGISFNGDTAAANALDDYEEGTWTPTVSQGTISPSTAKYIKIGSAVHLIAIISTFSDTTSSSAITIGGLPFTSSGAAANSIMHRFVNAGRPAVSNYVPDASTNMYLYGSTDNADYVLLQHNHLTSTNAAFFINLTYRTA